MVGGREDRTGDRTILKEIVSMAGSGRVVAQVSSGSKRAFH